MAYVRRVPPQITLEVSVGACRICNSICVYELRFAVGVARDLGVIRAAERKRILDGIRRRLQHEPTRMTKHVKQLRKLSPPFEHVPPIWQLRIGDHRVFYDVDETDRVVVVRAVRRKPPHTTTGEIL